MHWPQKTIRICMYLLFIITPLIFLPFTSELFEFNKMIVVYFLTAIITSSWAIDSVIQKKLVFQRTILDLAILIFLITQSLSLFFSIDPHMSIFGYYSRFNGGLLSLICYSILYWAYVTYMDQRSTLRTLSLALSTTALVSVYGILQHFGIDSASWVQDVQNRVFSTLGQPNWLASYLVALIFIPISFATSTKNRSIGIMHYAISVVFFLTLLFTKSRSGLLAFATSSVFFWGFYTFKTKKIRLFLILNTIFILLLLVTKNPIRDKIFGSSNLEIGISSTPVLEGGGTESGNIRKIVWTGALRIWQASLKNFIFGTGPETFAQSYYQFRPIEHNYTSEWELLYNKAHNEFLNYLANTGLFGLSAYLLLLGFMATVFIKYLQSEHAQRDPAVRGSSSMRDCKYLIIGLAAGWTSISVMNFWGFSVVITQILLFLLPAIAMSLNTQYAIRNTQSVISKSQIFSITLILFALSYTLYAIITYWSADISFAKGQRDFRIFSQTQDPKDAISSYQHLSQAYNLNPQEPAIISELSVPAAYMALLTAETDATTSAKFVSIAEAAANKAISISPYHPNYYKTKSRAMLVLATYFQGYFAKADEALVGATKISPTDPKIPYNRGIIAKYAGDKVLAKKYFQDYLTLKAANASESAEFLNLQLK